MALLDPPPDALGAQAAAVMAVCFCHHLRRGSRVASRTYDRVFQPLGLKASQFNVIVAIAAAAPATMAKVAGALAMDRTTLLRNLRPLREAGWLRVDGGRGRRGDELALTIAGQSLLIQAIAAWQEAQRSLAQSLGNGPAGTLLQGLGALAALR